jgi:hypothetical protein
VEASKSLTGGCLCGRITYTLGNAPLLTAICHCTHCQKQSGSAFSVNQLVRRDDLSISGDLATFEDRGASGAVIHRRFCPACGSPIVTEPLDAPEIAYLKTGTLDDRDGIDPSLQIWCASAQPWWRRRPEIQAFDGNIPD